MKKIPREIRLCACGCGRSFECKCNSVKRFIRGHNVRRISLEHRVCACGCGGEFLCKENSDRKYIQGHNLIGRKHKKGCMCASCRSRRGEYGGEGAPNYKGGPICVECECCGEAVKAWPYREGTIKFCSVECTNKSRVGKYCGSNSPTWKGGVSYGPYAHDFGSKLKERIRRRDGNRCWLCGKTREKEGRNMMVHHIDYDKMNTDPMNLISLCNSCHSKTNFNREHWRIRFQSIMLERFEACHVS